MTGGLSGLTAGQPLNKIFIALLGPVVKPVVRPEGGPRARRGSG